jgi:RHS repeat-associated protein
MTRVLLSIALVLAASTAAAQTEPVTVEYYHLDALGSVRAVTDATGGLIRTHDYRPFGEGENPAAGADAVRFTGKERDAETGLDYFGARYYASRSGRFTTVDPVMNVEAALVDPQRWNRYAYTRNNPLALVDPDGRDAITAMWRLMEVVRYNGPRLISVPTMIDATLRPALDAVFGAQVFSDPGGLRPHEAEFLKEIGAYKGMNTMGVADPNQPGIDAFAFSGGLLKTITPLEMKVTGSTSLTSVLDISADAARQVSRAGYAGKGFELHINAANLTAAGIAKFAAGGNQGLLNISREGSFASITIYAKDAIVRIIDGEVFIEQ